MQEQSSLTCSHLRHPQPSSCSVKTRRPYNMSHLSRHRTGYPAFPNATPQRKATPLKIYLIQVRWAEMLHQKGVTIPHRPPTRC